MKLLKLVFLLLPFLWAAPLGAQTIYTTSDSGDWVDDSNWGGGSSPNTTISGSDTVQVEGDTIYRDGDIDMEDQGGLELKNCATLTVSGDLSMENDSYLYVCDCCTLNIEGDVDLENNADIVVDGVINVGGEMEGEDGTCSSISGDGELNVDGGTDCESQIVLPVRLVLYEVERTSAQKVLLKWRTQSESNNSHFLIERSQDGESFEKIGRIEGSGTTVEPQEYRWTDLDPIQGTAYYRLIQVDFDGEVTEHPVKVVRKADHTGENSIRIAPSPESGVYTVHLGEEAREVTYRLYDLRGKLLRSEEKRGVRDFRVSSPLRKGLWILRVETPYETRSFKLR